MCVLFRSLHNLITRKKLKTQPTEEESEKTVISTLAPKVEPEKPKKVKWKLLGKILDKTATKCLRCGIPLQRASGQIVFYCAACRRLQRGGKRNRRIERRLERKVANG